ncbi:hypothetical protein DB346_20695 [Verrucomicrobia bacterium LW23]|nr:hypothetical protein DB346_20695 [Verrucomicrobia bacterium LW23]
MPPAGETTPGSAGDPAPVTPPPTTPPPLSTETPSTPSTTAELPPTPPSPAPPTTPEPAPSAPAPAPAPDPAASIPDKENLLFLNTTVGRIVIHMRPDLAPQHVERIKALVRSKFYDGKVFHRVIENFVAQGGDPLGNGRGGSGQRLPGEFTNTPFIRGTVGMARIPDDVNSADSQFFICFVPLPDLDGKYTVWGEVVAGMEVAEALAKGDPPVKADAISNAELPWDKPPAPVAKAKEEKDPKDKKAKPGDKSKIAATESTDAPKTDKPEKDKKDKEKDKKTADSIPVAQPVTAEKKDEKKKSISTPRPSGSNSKTTTSSNSKGR